MAVFSAYVFDELAGLINKRTVNGRDQYYFDEKKAKKKNYEQRDIDNINNYAWGIFKLMMLRGRDSLCQQQRVEHGEPKDTPCKLHDIPAVKQAHVNLLMTFDENTVHPKGGVVGVLPIADGEAKALDEIIGLASIGGATSVSFPSDSQETINLNAQMATAPIACAPPPEGQTQEN